MVHARVLDEYIYFALIYMNDNIFPVLPFPEHGKLRDQVVTIIISTLSLTLYGNPAIRSQNKKSTKTFSSIFKSLIFNLK